MIANKCKSHCWQVYGWNFYKYNFLFILKIDKTVKERKTFKFDLFSLLFFLYILDWTIKNGKDLLELSFFSQEKKAHAFCKQYEQEQTQLQQKQHKQHQRHKQLHTHSSFVHQNFHRLYDDLRHRVCTMLSTLGILKSWKQH